MRHLIYAVYSHNIGSTIAFALGIWVGNWAFNPLIVSNHSWTDGFFVRMIAAALFVLLFPWFTYRY